MTETIVRGLTLKIGDKVKFFPKDTESEITGIDTENPGAVMLTVKNGARTLQMLARQVHSLVVQP